MASASAPAWRVEELELALLLDALFQSEGYDYRGHLRQRVGDRIAGLMAQRGIATISALQAQILHQPAACEALLRALQARPALMFDSPTEVALLRMTLGPCLHGAATPRVWLADCAGAQQAWTLAILLDQEQLGARTDIHATVTTELQLAEARAASLPMARLSELEANYLRCGGTGRLLDYFEVNPAGTHALPLARLRQRITWAQHNLVTDASFNEFELIMGQRALPDFGPALRQRVLKLFDASLAQAGLLVLDQPLAAHEPLARRYRQIIAHHPWYKRAT